MRSSAVEKKIVPLQRAMPYNEDAELGALSSATCDRAAFAEVLDRLTIEDFYLPVHQLVFACFQEIDRQGKPLELIGLSDSLTMGMTVENLPESLKRGRLERNEKPVITIAELGGRASLTQVFTFVPTGANAGYYIDIVREKALARVVIQRLTEVVRVAYDETNDIKDVLDQAQSALLQIIADSGNAETFRNLVEGAQHALEKLQYACAHRGEAVTALGGIATGFVDYDRATYGAQPGQLIVYGARPGQGKTALAGNMAMNMAKAGVPVAFFSMEMTYDDLIERMFCSESGITINKFRDGMLSREEFDDEVNGSGPFKTAKKLLGLPIWIDDTPSLTTAQFKARARLIKMRRNVQVIFVDYLQLMRSLSRRAQDARWLEITEISGTLKAMAKELRIPIIALCQLNREAEARDTSFCKPKLSDLRESGSIEQDADVVAMLWRPDRHLAPPKFGKQRLAKVLELKDNETALWTDEAAKNPELQTLRDCQLREYVGFNIVKHRNGPPAEIRLRFIGELTLFQSTTKKAFSNNPLERQEGYEEEANE